jgi:hypothetical protein
MAAGDFVFMQANQFNTGFTKADVRAASYSPEFGMVWVGS